MGKHAGTYKERTDVEPIRTPKAKHAVEKRVIDTTPSFETFGDDAHVVAREDIYFAAQVA